LEGNSRKPGVMYSKIGAFGDNYDDCGIIERVSSGQLLRYVAVGLAATDAEVLTKLIVHFDIMSQTISKPPGTPEREKLPRVVTGAG
jgi:hypothetical protein